MCLKSEVKFRDTETRQVARHFARLCVVQYLAKKALSSLRMELLLGRLLRRRLMIVVLQGARMEVG